LIGITEADPSPQLARSILSDAPLRALRQSNESRVPCASSYAQETRKRWEICARETRETRGGQRERKSMGTTKRIDFYARHGWNEDASMRLSVSNERSFILCVSWRVYRSSMNYNASASAGDACA